jgi:cellulose synthase/poly-beta-1,6-N-acetylglucosamine synthase-like glycosyltransferase
MRMLVVIAARDDGAALRVTLPTFAGAMRPGLDRLLVVADRCRDDTAAVARAGGAAVRERPEGIGRPGKAGALLFGLESEPAEGLTAVFDADSRPSPGFCAAAESALSAGQVGQAFVAPIAGRSLLSRLSAYSEIVSQRVSDRLRERLGWGVPLRGTGMVVPTGLLREELARCSTQVEDLELTLLFAARGIRVARLPASVEDPKPELAAGLAAQRARWMAGQLSALRARRREIARLVRRLEGATLVLSLFGKPRSLFFALRLALLVVLLAVARSPVVLAAAGVVSLFLARDLAWLLAGLAVVDRPAEYVPVVLAAPLYPLLWAASAVRSLSARGRWLSARRPP